VYENIEAAGFSKVSNDTLWVYPADASGPGELCGEVGMNGKAIGVGEDGRDGLESRCFIAERSGTEPGNDECGEWE